MKMNEFTFALNNSDFYSLLVMLAGQMVFLILVLYTSSWRRWYVPVNVIHTELKILKNLTLNSNCFKFLEIFSAISHLIFDYTLVRIVGKPWQHELNY